MDAEKWYEKVLSIHDLVEIPINGKIALFSASLPPIHKDPGDRIIIATAITHGAQLISFDKQFLEYDELEGLLSPPFQ